MAGLGIPGGLRLDGRAALRLGQEAAEAGLAPVLFTEVSGFDATAMSAAFAATCPGVATGTGIVPLGARTVTATAMAARTAAELSGSRYLLGVGVSTRQIVSGWHEAAYDASVVGTRRRLEELRAVLSGERRGSFTLTTTGNADIGLLLGAMGPRMTALALEVADGVILNHTPPSQVPAAPDGKQVVAYCWVLCCPDGDARVRRDLVSYAMAAPYARHFRSLGFAEVVDDVQRLHAAGRLREAPARLPREMVDALSTAPDDLAQRLAEYEVAGALPVVMPVTGERPVEEISSFLQSRV